MSKQMRKLLMGAMILLFSILVVTNQPVSAANSKTTIRVAYYPLHGFFEYDSKGKEVGYGVELLNKISQYTGIKFQYKKADSWESTKQMLLDGQADLRLPGTVPIKPSETLHYNATSILSTYDAIMSLDERDDLNYTDFKKFKTVKIAVSTGFYTADNVQSYLDEIGIKKSQLIFCKDYNESYKLLKDKKVDALISNIMDMNSEMKLLYRFKNQYNFFSMLKTDDRINTLENAMIEILANEPTFLTDLYAKWYPERVNNPYTSEERTYLSSIKSLTFAFRTDEGYLSRRENGKYYGIYVELAKAICKKLDVKFKAVSIDDCLEGREKTDVYSGFFFDQNYAKKMDFAISGPINDINYYIIKKKEKEIDREDCKIAALKKFKYTRDYILKKYPKATMVYLETYEECLKAVESGKADMAIINNYIAEYYLSKYQFSDLSTSLSDEYSHLYCFATPNQNQVLASILTKELRKISETETTQIYIKGQEDKPTTSVVQTAIYQNPVQVVLIAVAIIALVLTVAFLLIYAKRRKKQNIELTEALSAKSDFLARMSHDMRTPMNGILGLTTLMQDQEMSDDIRKAVSQIQISGKYLLDLINDTLDMNKIELKRLQLYPTPTNVKEITDNIITNARILANQKGIKLEVYRIHPENMIETFLYVDGARTEQIFMNLISNAVKFTPIGGQITASIERIKTTKEQIVSRYIIEDTGIGMSQEFLKHLYEPFAQEERDGNHNAEGTGLGLSIVKQLVEMMHGDIEVESKMDVGTKFTLTIPFDRYEGEVQEQEKVNTSEVCLEGKRILLCEDHPLNMSIAVKLLEKKGLLVETAEDGCVGFEKFKASEVGYYDVILMDLRMPNMDGYEATEKIRGLDREDAIRIPIIAMTANAFDDDVAKCMEVGMVAHIAKPIDVEVMYQTLERVLN